MKVSILSHTINPVETVYRAYRQCYHKGTATNLELPSVDKQMSFIENCMKAGHDSPLEHVSFTFSLEGFSRVTQQQLTRHRLASYSIQSQRYVDAENFEFVTPTLDYIDDDTKRYVAESYFTALFRTCMMEYKTLLDLGVKKEDARYILPVSATGNMVVTMNVRSLRHFFEERLNPRAQWEIRKMAGMMLEAVKELFPIIDSHLNIKTS